jgi:hypothetical protein
MACQETQGLLAATVPGEWHEQLPLSPSHEFIRSYQYYRHDGAKNRDLEAGDEGYKGMPHGGEHIIPGAAFLVSLNARGLSELAQSALVWSLEQWCLNGATAGGQSSRGHGRIAPYLWLDQVVTSELFTAYLEDSIETMRAFVRTLYVTTSEAAGKGKRSKKGAKDEQAD